MTFSFTNYAAIEPQASPWQDVIGKVLGGYTDMTKANFLKPGLEEELKKNKLFNEYYGKDMESKIGLRGAQAGEAGARTGLLGEQTKGARIENQYLPKKMQAQIAEAEAGAQKARLMQMIREQLMGGGQMGGNQAQQRAQAGQSGGQMDGQMGQPGQGQGAIPQQAQQQMPQEQPQQPQQPRGMDYAQAATAMQLLGLGKPHVVDANGKYMAITPFGNIDTGVHGLSEKDKELSKQDARKIAGLEDVVLSNTSKMDTFRELNSILGSPEFEAMRQNPIAGSHELGYYSKFGTKAQQKMVGEAQTYMGNIIKDSARDFAGQFRVGEQALLNNMKPNPGDSLDMMKGKSEALTFLTIMMTKRAELEAEFMRKDNLSALQAKKAADHLLDPKAIKNEIHSILHPAKKVEITPDQAIAELQRRQAAGKQ